MDLPVDQHGRLLLVIFFADTGNRRDSLTDLLLTEQITKWSLPWLAPMLGAPPSSSPSPLQKYSRSRLAPCSRYFCADTGNRSSARWSAVAPHLRLTTLIHPRLLTGPQDSPSIPPIRHKNKERGVHLDFVFLCGHGESNPDLMLGKHSFYH